MIDYKVNVYLLSYKQFYFMLETRRKQNEVMR